MKYNLCSSCQYFQVKIMTEEYVTPKCCTCPALADVFGSDVGGFPMGIDIIFCQYHMQWPWNYGDVFIESPDGKRVSYVLTQPRNFKLIRVPKLYDNSRNIKAIKLDSNETDSSFF